jgi:hypothetical protein
MLRFGELNNSDSALPAMKATNTSGNVRLFESANRGGARRKSRKGKRKGLRKSKKNKSIRRACF